VEDEMPRAHNPIDSVVTYFKTAPLDAAVLALHVVKGIVKDRQPAAAPKAAKRKKRISPVIDTVEDSASIGS
jgi:hypothetical protein